MAENTKFAVGIEDLFWESAENEDEAIKSVREQLKELTDDEVDDLDLEVFDSIEE